MQAARLIHERFLSSAAPAEDVTTVREPPAVAQQPTETRAPEETPAPINPPLKNPDSWFKDRDYDHPYLTGTRGLREETLRHFGVGFHSGRGLMANRCVIPIHNEHGELVAFAGRWPGNDPPQGEGKYKLPAQFQKSAVLFNLHRVKALATEHGLIVCEGFFDVMDLFEQGRENAVAIMGSSLSCEQERLIVEAVGREGRVTLMFDDDAAGEKCTADALTRLNRHVFVKVKPFTNTTD